jgi:hypothetical protein
MFRLLATVKRGTANFSQARVPYPTRELAVAAARALVGHERVLRVMVVSTDVPPRFVEWVER